MRSGTLFSVLALIGFVLAVGHPTDLVFVRHGETQANATGKYNSKTLNTFSTKGEAEVEALTQQLLKQKRFDRILVSPSPRVLNTIAPYLRATHQKATVWPLLYECCTGHRPSNAHATKFTYGAKIKIPSAESDLFIVDSSDDRLPVSPDYNAGLAQVDASISEFNQKLTGGRVLLVGHSGHGGHFLHELTGKWHKLDNAKEFELFIK